jgi:hypothetical protein
MNLFHGLYLNPPPLEKALPGPWNPAKTKALGDYKSFFSRTQDPAI